MHLKDNLQFYKTVEEAIIAPYQDERSELRGEEKFANIQDNRQRYKRRRKLAKVYKVEDVRDTADAD